MTAEISRQDLPPVGAELDQGRVNYRAWLDEVDDELVAGALVVVDALPRIVRAFLQGDRTVAPEARSLATDIRERVRHIEEQGFLLLAREAPVSGDLRRLVAILRLVHDLDRAGRLMKHVAEGAEVDAHLLPAELRQQLEELATRSMEVFRSGVDAWRRRDALAVHELDRMDSEVDTVRAGLDVQARALAARTAIPPALALVGRYFERLADHGVAFAQHATFVVTGERVEVGP